MFSWLKRKSAAVAPMPTHVPAHVPSGIRIYAFGDVHGRLDCLEDLLTRIKADAADFSGRKIVIGLGDYIDRGPASKGVIDRLMQPLGDGLDGEFLLGNHEQVLLGLFDEDRKGATWLTYGGVETLLSYNIQIPAGGFTPELVSHVQEQLRAHFPADHREWLLQRPTHLTYGDYHFVHAGVNPQHPLDAQSDGDRLWIRHAFLDYTGMLEKVVVHGHTISDEIEIRPHRIGIDTGAYASGRLSAIVLEGENRRVLQTDRP